MKKKILNKNKGFTLIELLVVIAIIGLLSSVVFASLSSARSKARDAKRIAEIGQLRKAIELYFDSEGNGLNYPVIPNGSDGSGYPLSGLSGALSPYLSRIPEDPLGATWHTYQYVRGSPDSWGVYVKLENGGACLSGEKINTGWWSVGKICNF